METVYMESTIPSCLTARRSNTEPMASRQRITRWWWEHERPRFRVYSSIAVRAEISRGDQNAALRRLKSIADIPELELRPELEPLAKSIVQLLELPPRAQMDATHVAFAIVHHMDYLLTWNCTHLANAILQRKLFEYCAYHNLHVPVICTPDLLIQPNL